MLKRDDGHRMDFLFLVGRNRQRKCQGGRHKDGGKDDEVKPIPLRSTARVILLRGYTFSSALGIETRVLWYDNAVPPSYLSLKKTLDFETWSC